ncbi:MAG: YrhA family protein [Lachnospirales bacterium]
MYIEELNLLIKEISKYNDKMNEGVLEKDLNLFVNVFKKIFGLSLPYDYLEFLKNFNGIEFNGFIIYGVDKDLLSIKPSNNINGLIQFNNVFYENEHQKKYIFLGENNISWYVYDIKLNTYFELDNPSGMEVNKFINFKDMLKKFILGAI